jgi:hypothetical protein
MSRRALVGVVAFAALLVGVVWRATQPQTPSPAATSTRSDAAPPARLPSEVPTRRHAEPAADEEVPVAASGGVSIGIGRAVERPKATFAFVVRTEQGAPVPGARLCVRTTYRGKGTQVAATDAEGRASVAIVIDERELLMVDAVGFVSREARPGDEVVVLKPAGQIAGVVIDAEGRPVSGAEVSGGAGRVQTDLAGRFEIAVDPYRDEIGLTVRREGFLRWEDDRRPGDRDVRVRLVHGCTIEGRIVLPDGRAPEAGGVDIVDVDKEGMFHASGLAPGERVLSAWGRLGDRAFAAATTVTLHDGETRRDLRIVLHDRARSFAVLRVVGPDGVPVTFAAARAEHDGGESTVGGGQIIVPVDGPPEREEHVTFFRASARDIEYGDLHIDVVTRAAPNGEPLVVTLPRVALLAVNVVLPEEPSPLVARWAPVVRLEQTGGPSLHVDTQPSETRQSVFRVAVGGSYRAHVEADGFAPVVRDVTPDELAAGHASVRVSRGASVRVHVVAQSPARMSEPWIVLGADRPDDWRLAPKGGARADGRYAIEHVRPGKCDARIVCCGSIVEKTLTIDVPESGVLELGDVVLDGTTPLKGRVVTPDGRPAGGAAIEYYDRRRLMAEDGVHALTRIDGTFEVDVPVGATGDLCVSKTELGGVMVPLDGKAAWTEIRLQPECRLRVVTRAKSARGWEASFALARPGGTGLWFPPLDGETRSNDAETVEVLRGLAPGKWVVRLFEETPAIEREVTLVAGETTEVVLDEPK